MKPKIDKHSQEFTVIGKPKPVMAIELFRKKWLKKGYELVDITQLCEFKLGQSGYCNEFNNPDEKIYHIQVHYRDENICSFPDPNKNCDEKYVIFETNEDDCTGRDFIIFRKVLIEED